MKKRKKQQTASNKNLKIGLVFCFIVFFLIFVSAAAKISSIILKSKFDSSHRFNIVYSPSENSKFFEVVSFSPDTESISILKVNTDKEISDLTQAAKVLKFPVDGIIKLKQKDTQPLFTEKDVDSNLQSLLFKLHETNTNLTLVDLARLWFFAKKISLQSTNLKEISIKLDEVDESQNLLLEKVLSQFFIDNTLSQEKVSIEIVNGTGVGGLGNKLAKMITNMGGNVVSVVTADNVIEASEIQYYGNKNYTLEKLNKILGFKIVPMQGQEISDIVINLGRDSLVNLAF